ncbi:hypothetical protein V6N11_057534 [Hibiscus sabdariffa]|uniref:RNase H type-1 domain-containing protein n=1 Tax=Hibiscus sabdariffa TaxID=183260 RepID=A0ABR2NH32_9ROSI
MSSDSSCSACNCPQELTLHVLRDCVAAREFWLQILPVALIRPFFDCNLQQWISCNLFAIFLHHQSALPWNRNLAWAKHYSESAMGRQIPTAGPYSGDWIMGFAKAIGHSNSLQAELWALFEATSSILSLVRAIHCLRQKCWATIVSWVPRDDNRPADAMAKIVNSPDFSLHVYFEPSLGVDLLLNSNKNRL